MPGSPYSRSNRKAPVYSGYEIILTGSEAIWKRGGIMHNWGEKGSMLRGFPLA
jgi:hypothetical protein